MRILTVEEMMRQIPVGNRSTPTDPRRGFYLRGVPLWDAAVRKVSTVEACRAGAVKANECKAEQRWARSRA